MFAHVCDCTKIDKTWEKFVGSAENYYLEQINTFKFNVILLIALRNNLRKGQFASRFDGAIINQTSLGPDSSIQFC